MSGGTRRTVTIVLNRTGRRLLADFRRLRLRALDAILTITARGSRTPPIKQIVAFNI